VSRLTATARLAWCNIIVAGQETAVQRSSAPSFGRLEGVSAGRIVDVETKSQACAMGGVVYLRAQRGCMLYCDKEVRGVPTYMYLASMDWVWRSTVER
jgi:hypothetical protein